MRGSSRRPSAATGSFGAALAVEGAAVIGGRGDVDGGREGVTVWMRRAAAEAALGQQQLHAVIEQAIRGHVVGVGVNRRGVGVGCGGDGGATSAAHADTLLISLITSHHTSPPLASSTTTTSSGGVCS